MINLSIMPLFTDHVEEICNDIIEQQRTGVSTHAMFMMKFNPEGTPAVDKATRECKKYDLFRERLDRAGAKHGVLVQATSLLLGFGFKDIEIAYIGEGYEKYEGKSVYQIAKEEGMSNLDAYLMLCEKSDFKGRVNMGPYTTPEIISDFEKNPLCLYMTDAWVEDFGVQNPAIYDCFPKFLRDSLLGTGDTLANTINRMTGATAERFNLKERGYIRPGYFADLTVFSEDELRNAVPDQQKSFGIRKVWINGTAVLDNDTLDQNAIKTSGRSIKV